MACPKTAGFWHGILPPIGYSWPIGSMLCPVEVFGLRAVNNYWQCGVVSRDAVDREP